MNVIDIRTDADKKFVRGTNKQSGGDEKDRLIDVVTDWQIRSQSKRDKTK